MLVAVRLDAVQKKYAFLESVYRKSILSHSCYCHFIVTLVANKNTGEEIIGYTIVDRFIFLCYSSFKYLLISAIPFKLSYLYPFPFQVGEKIPMALWIYPFVILFIGYVIYLNRRKPLLVFCTLFFILHLLRCFM